MKRKYLFSWEIKSIQEQRSESWVEGDKVTYKITTISGLVYITDNYAKEGIIMITFLVQTENLIEDRETVIN